MRATVGAMGWDGVGGVSASYTYNTIRNVETFILDQCEMKMAVRRGSIGERCLFPFPLNEL